MTKTAAELRQELARKNSEARDLRRALRKAEKQEMLSAKTALGEALSALVFADTTEALQALVQTLNEPAIADEMRRILGVNNTENPTPRRSRMMRPTGPQLNATTDRASDRLWGCGEIRACAGSTPAPGPPQEPRDTVAKRSVFTGLKTHVFPGSEAREPERHVSFAGAMGWAAKQGPDPSIRRCSGAARRGSECSEQGPLLHPHCANELMMSSQVRERG